MSKRMTIFLIALLAFVLIAMNSLYVVSEKQRAVLLRFGQIVNANVSPGLHFKVPFIEKLRVFDARLQSLELPSSRFLTQEKKAVIVDAYVKWRIANVQRWLLFCLAFSMA